MADKAMNEFNTGTSARYAYVEDSNGNQVRASMATLGKTLWGQNQTNVTTQDWNTLTGPGLYAVSNATGSNRPTNSYNYGLLEVIAAVGIIVQRYYPDGTGKECCYRTKFSAQEWRPWRYFAYS